MLPDEHALYTRYNRSCFGTTLTVLVYEIQKLNICSGLAHPKDQNFLDRHVIPKKFDYEEYQHSQDRPPWEQIDFIRARTCILLCEGEQCLQCRKFEMSMKSQEQWKAALKNTPAKACAPITFTSPERLKLTLQSVRLQCKQQAKKIEEMRDEIVAAGQRVDNFLDDFKTIFSNHPPEKIPPFMRLFWEEQQKYTSKRE